MRQRNLFILSIFLILIINGCGSNDAFNNVSNEEFNMDFKKEFEKKLLDEKKLLEEANEKLNKEIETISKDSTLEMSKDLSLSISSAISKTLENIEGNYTFGFKDLKTGETFIKNNSRKPAASVIKIYIMIEAFNQVNQGKISLNDTLTYTSKDKVGGSGSIQSGPLNKSYTINDLINKMMQVSDNVATNMLINHLGMDNINNTILNLGCIDTVLGRKMMDLEAPKQGRENYISPKDLILTFEKLYKGQVISPSLDSQMLKIMEGNTMRSKLPSKLGSVRISHKTGENVGIENDAGIVYTSKGAYIITVTTDSGSSSSQRSAMANLSKKIYDLYMAHL